MFRKVAETELTDIFEGGYLCIGRDGFIDDVVKQNIEEALEREGILKRGMDVIIPPGGFQEINCDDGFYQYDFMVYDENDRPVYAGTAYGRAICDKSEFRRTGDECRIRAEIVDMEVELYK